MASAGARFESARASGDRAAARAAVEDIVSDAKDPAKRAALASSGAAVSIAAELLRAARAACWCDAADATEAADAFLVPFAPLARALRNVCAGNAVARGGACALPRCDAPEALALALPALAARVDRSETGSTGSRISGSSGSEFTEKASSGSSLAADARSAAVSALAAATQLACNLITGGGTAAETTWCVLFPRHFAVIAALKHEGAARATHPALCSAMSARFAAVGFRSSLESQAILASGSDAQTHGRQTDVVHDAYDERAVCGFVAGATVWRPLLRASVGGGDDADDDDGGGDVSRVSRVEDVGATLVRFVESFCLFGGEAAPPLCRALAPLAAETARARDEALRRKILGMALDADGAREGTKDYEKNDTHDEAAVRERFSVEQATLLELVARAVAAAPARDPSPRGNARDPSASSAACETNAPPATLVLSEGTAAYVLDLASRAAEALERARRASSPAGDVAPGPGAETETEPEGEDVCQVDAARVTLRACLGVLRALSEREARPAVAQTPGDDVTSACAMGAPRLLLGLLAALPVPAGAGNSEKKKARGPSAAPELSPKTFEPIKHARSESSNDGSNGSNGSNENESLDESLATRLRASASAPYPSVRPWDGYRVDALAPLANAMFGRPAVCEAVQKLGGVPVILACTRGEDGDEYLREYALWAVRNVCAGSDAARREIEALQPRAAADAHELAAAGLNVSVDPETGRVKVGNTEERKSERAIPENGNGSGPGGFSVASARGGLGTVMFSGGGENAKTPVGRAVQAALEAGLEPALPGDDEDVEVPKHWKIANLS